MSSSECLLSLAGPGSWRPLPSLLRLFQPVERQKLQYNVYHPLVCRTRLRFEVPTLAGKKMTCGASTRFSRAADLSTSSASSKRPRDTNQRGDSGISLVDRQLEMFWSKLEKDSRPPWWEWVRSPPSSEMCGKCTLQSKRHYPCGWVKCIFWVSPWGMFKLSVTLQFNCIAAKTEPG